MIFVPQYDSESIYQGPFIELKIHKNANTKLRSTSFQYQKLLPIEYHWHHGQMIDGWRWSGICQNIHTFPFPCRVINWHKPVKIGQASLDLGSICDESVRCDPPTHTILLLWCFPPRGGSLRPRCRRSGSVGCCSSFRDGNFLMANETIRHPSQQYSDNI